MEGSRGAPVTTGPCNRDAVGGEIAAAARACAQNSACLAISGNFSARVDANSVLITAAGSDKAACTPDNLVRVGLDGEVLGGGPPSSDTDLHLALYALEPAAGAVMHEHSVAATVLSRLGGEELVFEGYELAKAFAGIASHRARLALPILDNSEDRNDIVTALRRRHQRTAPPWAFLVRSHGLYAWGADIPSAQRHLEAWEFLLACELARRQVCAGLPIARGRAPTSST